MTPSGVYPRVSGEDMRTRLALLRDAQALPLEEKINQAEKMIGEVAAGGKVGVMFSGGRDSCAVAVIAKKHSPTLLHCDTGLASVAARDRVSAVARMIGLPLIIAKPEAPAFEMWARLGHFPIGPKRGHTYLKRATGIKTSPVQCCYHLKERPAKIIIRGSCFAGILWGNRADDSNRRKLGLADHGMVHAPSSRWPCWSIEPVALFSDADISEVVSHMGITFESRGEAGCQVCCTDLARRDNQLSRCFAIDREAFNAAILSGLGAQILKARGEAHTDGAVIDALENAPARFLRIPKIGKKSAGARGG